MSGRRVSGGECVVAHHPEILQSSRWNRDSFQNDIWGKVLLRRGDAGVEVSYMYIISEFIPNRRTQTC